jgi:hypothetical protein
MRTVYSIFIAVVLFGAACLLTYAMREQKTSVQAGLDIELFDVIVEEEPTALARFRFLVPDIAGGAVSFTVAFDYMVAMCEGVALPLVQAKEQKVDEIVISFSAEVVPFGQAVPEVTQYFQPFSIDDDQCEWEEF